MPGPPRELLEYQLRCTLFLSSTSQADQSNAKYVHQTCFNWKFQRGAVVIAACPGVRSSCDSRCLLGTEFWHRALSISGSSVWLVCTSAFVPLRLRTEWVRFRMAMDWTSGLQNAEPALLSGDAEYYMRQICHGTQGGAFSVGFLLRSSTCFSACVTSHPRLQLVRLCAPAQGWGHFSELEMYLRERQLLLRSFHCRGLSCGRLHFGCLFRHLDMPVQVLLCSWPPDFFLKIQVFACGMPYCCAKFAGVL